MRFEQIQAKVSSKTEKNNIFKPVFNLKAISSAGVEQNGVGDCFFEAALASLANSKAGQQTIADSIKIDKNGNYQVTFAGDKNHPIKVTQSDLKQNFANGFLGNNALWANIIETAFYKYDHIGQYGTKFPFNLQIENLPYFTRAVHVNESLALLTGKSSTMIPTHFVDNNNFEFTVGKVDLDNVKRDLNQALNTDHLPVVASSARNLLSKIGLLPDCGPLFGNHIYSVLKYNNKTKNVTVRNPWGTNIGGKLSKIGSTVDGITSLPDGELKMSVQTFDKYFTDVNIGGLNPVKSDFLNVYYENKQSFKNLGSAFESLTNKHYETAKNDLIDFSKKQINTVSDSLFLISDLTERPLRDILKKSIATSYDFIDSYCQKVKQAYKHI